MNFISEIGGHMFRKLLTSTAVVVGLGGMAFAADLPSRSPPPVYLPPPPVFTWTGFYLGGEVGYQFGRESTTIVTSPGLASLGALPSYNNSGVVGGAHIGINVQASQFVYGFEADIEGGGIKGSAPVTAAFAAPVTGVSMREDIESTYRARAGIAFDRALFYGTGGLAIVDFNNTFTSALGTDSDNHYRIGWTFGGGLEYAVTNNWSLRGEYRYTFFRSSADYLANSSPGTLAANSKETDNSVRIGFSYKFGPPEPAPVVAKY